MPQMTRPSGISSHHSSFAFRRAGLSSPPYTIRYTLRTYIPYAPQPPLPVHNTRIHAFRATYARHMRIYTRRAVPPHHASPYARGSSPTLREHYTTAPRRAFRRATPCHSPQRDASFAATRRVFCRYTPFATSCRDAKQNFSRKVLRTHPPHRLTQHPATTTTTPRHRTHPTRAGMPPPPRACVCAPARPWRGARAERARSASAAERECRCAYASAKHECTRGGVSAERQRECTAEAKPKLCASARERACGVSEANGAGERRASEASAVRARSASSA